MHRILCRININKDNHETEIPGYDLHVSLFLKDYYDSLTKRIIFY